MVVLMYSRRGMRVDSGESFDLMAEAEAEASILLENHWDDTDMENKAREGLDG